MFAFFDESGKLADSDFVCMAGYLSDDARWDVFVQQWAALLKKHEIPAIHMKQLVRREGPFATWLDAYTDNALGEFIEVVRKNALVGFGVGVDSQALRSMNSNARRNLGDPQYLCFQRLLRLIVDKLSAIGYEAPMPIAFDDTEEYSVRCYRMWPKLRARYPELKRRIASISFADDEVFYPLQGADVLAHQTRNYQQSKIKGNEKPNIYFEKLVTPHSPEFGIDYVSELWNREGLEDLWAKIQRGELANIATLSKEGK